MSALFSSSDKGSGSSVRTPYYYELHCPKCDQTFLPIVATSEDEMLAPDYERMEEQGFRPRHIEELQLFYRQHSLHGLIARSADGEWSTSKSSREEHQQLNEKGGA